MFLHFHKSLSITAKFLIVIHSDLHIFQGILPRNYFQIQLSLSSRALHGGAYFSDVSGWKSIPISVPGPYECLKWHRLLGFCLTITFCLNPAQQAVSLWNCRVCWRICLFYSYGFVTNGKYLWSPRWEILQFQWQFQLETAWCAGFRQKVIVRQKPSSLCHSVTSHGPGTLIGIEFHPETSEK